MERKHLSTIKEGSAEVYVYSDDVDTVPSKSMNVFYNKKMEINRDLSNLAINVYGNMYDQEDLIIVDSMAASGIGSLRMLRECKGIKKVYINDINPIAVELIKENLKLNPLKDDSVQVEISRKDANLLHLEIAQRPFIAKEEQERHPHVISIDPFGTPNLYLDSAFKAIARTKGLMCITATDTAVLFGIRPKACIRKYLSKPLHNDYCKETGARILLHFISRIANINKLGIKPLITFYSNHFIRVISLTFKNKNLISQDFNKYGFIIHCKSCGFRKAVQSDFMVTPFICPICKEEKKLDHAGPLWIGEIHDPLFLEKLIEINEQKEYQNKKRLKKILSSALNECHMPLSYFNIHKLSQKLKLHSIPKIDEIIACVQKMGNKASRTHFDFISIKTDMSPEDLKDLLLKM